ncbi:MAG TPA: YqhA family protein [Novosphingobium sp.]|nr:YqhA family protein [Novosphingobium sp.]
MLTRQRNRIEKYYRKSILPSLEVFENFVEFIVFMWRWILAPSYIALGFCLLLLTIKTVQDAWSLRKGFANLGDSMAIVKILGIVDIILVSNLIIMVLFVGYVNFVSKIKLDGEDDRPSWMDSLDYSGLKIQLLGSIVAISSVQLLRQYMDMSESANFDSTKLTWMIAVHLTFVISILLFAIVNRLHDPASDADEQAIMHLTTPLGAPIRMHA